MNWPWRYPCSVSPPKTGLNRIRRGHGGKTLRRGCCGAKATGSWAATSASVHAVSWIWWRAHRLRKPSCLLKSKRAAANTLGAPWRRWIAPSAEPWGVPPTAICAASRYGRRASASMSWKSSACRQETRPSSVTLRMRFRPDQAIVFSRSFCGSRPESEVRMNSHLIFKVRLMRIFWILNPEFQ